MSGDEIRRCAAVKRLNVRRKFIEIFPQPFFVQEFQPPARNPHDPQVRITGVAADFLGEFGRPRRIIDAARHDIDLDAEFRHRHADFFDIHQLPAEIRVFGQMRVLLIEIALRIEKNHAHCLFLLIH